MVATDGATYAAGDAEDEFTIMSVSKPFVFALVCDALGADAGPRAARRQRHRPAVQLARGGRAKRRRTDESDGQPGRDRGDEPRPRVDRGAKWQAIHDGLSRFAGRALGVDEEVYRSASETNDRNQAIAGVLDRLGRIYCDPAEAIDLYTRQCCLNVSATDLAVMGATLADGGVNPRTGERVVDQAVCRSTLAVMTIAGLYETSGDWLYDVGLPGKSGIGGGIVTVSPGKGGLGTFAPRLDEAGNSVKGQLASRFLSSAARPRPLRLGAGGVIARLVVAAAAAALLLPSLASGAGPSDEQALAKRYAPVVRLVAQAHECGNGESYDPIDVDALFDEPTVALRGPWGQGDLVKIAPVGGRPHRGALRVPPRLPRQPARSGLRLRALGPPHHGGNVARPSTRTSPRTRATPASSPSSTGSSTSSTTGTTRTRATGR